jgi:serine/threonine protein kinase
MERKTIGRYEILDELGRGAMGCVLRARDPAMGRVVALKCILSSGLAGDQMQEFRERFYREARAAGALSHPGIVPVFDVGEDSNVPYLVMELVQGRTLDAALKQGERYSIERICEIGKQMADALGYAHRNGVIHRDIKPANILMTSREVYGTERPRITDFGVAKLAGGDVTTTGQLLGTPAFMPPEQFTGAPIDGRTDLFALGVILYRMTTGEQPFAGETLTAVSYKIVHTDPIPPSKLNPSVPAQVEAVILKCLAKSAADRYQTGEDLAAALGAALPGARATGPYRTDTQAAGETIDQVSSLRPRPAAETVAAPSLPPGTQSRPAPRPTWPATVSSPPAPPQPPSPAPTWARTSPSASPAPLRPASAPAPQAPGPQPVPSAPAQARSAPPPAIAPTFARPAPAEPRQQPVPVPFATAATRSHPPAPHPDATLRPAHSSRSDGPMMSTRATRTGTRREVEEPEPAKRRGMSVLAWLVLIALAVGGSWFFLQLHPTASSDANQSVDAPTAAASAAAVNFNPKSLDPKTNAGLRLDLSSLPSALMVTVQLDGNTYWTGTAGDHDSYSGLFLPPGQHSLRVLVAAGGAQRASGLVDAVFQADKTMTLTVKLWPENNGAFDPASDIIISLHRNLF